MNYTRSKIRHQGNREASSTANPVSDHPANDAEPAAPDITGQDPKMLVLSVDLGNDSCRVQGILLAGSSVIQGPQTVQRFSSSSYNDGVPTLIAFHPTPALGVVDRAPFDWGYGAIYESECSAEIPALSFPKMAEHDDFTDWTSAVAYEFVGFATSQEVAKIVPLRQTFPKTKPSHAVITRPIAWPRDIVIVSSSLSSISCLRDSPRPE